MPLVRIDIGNSATPELAKIAHITGRIVQLPAHDALEIEHMLTALRQHGCHIEDLEMGRADLEDIFISLTSRK